MEIDAVAFKQRPMPPAQSQIKWFIHAPRNATPITCSRVFWHEHLSVGVLEYLRIHQSSLLPNQSNCVLKHFVGGFADEYLS
jgi:hypothetical protein